MSCRNSDNNTETVRSSDLPRFEIPAEDMDNPPCRALYSTFIDVICCWAADTSTDVITWLSAEVLRGFILALTLSIASSKNTLSQPFIEKCISDAMRIWLNKFRFYPSIKAMKSQVLHTAWCYITGEAARQIWHWSLLGVKGLTLSLPRVINFKLPLQPH